MGEGIRRVVTGLDEQGRSAVLFDDRVAGQSVLWHSDTVPVDNAGRQDAAAREFSMHDLLHIQGSAFVVSEMPPAEPGAEPFMHATDTIDYIVVLRGRVAMHLETGVVDLGPGDVVIDRGIFHGWLTIGDEPVLMFSVMLPAAPVGAGATI